MGRNTLQQNCQTGKRRKHNTGGYKHNYARSRHWKTVLEKKRHEYFAGQQNTQ
jgi:hypothetical protein